MTAPIRSVIKDNHYPSPAYCFYSSPVCTPVPDGPYYVSQLDSNLQVEWSFKNIFLNDHSTCRLTVELGNITRPIRHRRAHRTTVETVCRRWIVVIFNHDRIGAVMLVHSRRRVPTEAVSVGEISVGIEVKKVSPLVVEIVGGAEDYRSIR